VVGTLTLQIFLRSGYRRHKRTGMQRTLLRPQRDYLAAEVTRFYPDRYFRSETRRVFPSG